MNEMFTFWELNRATELSVGPWFKSANKKWNVVKYFFPISPNVLKLLFHLYYFVDVLVWNVMIIVKTKMVRTINNHMGIF